LLEQHKRHVKIDFCLTDPISAYSIPQCKIRPNGTQNDATLATLMSQVTCCQRCR